MRASLLWFATLTAVTAVTAASAPAAADTSYAIVVGANRGGSGQVDLRYAEDDAKRVGELLVELGGYDRKNITTIAQPDPDKVLTAIAKVASRAKADTEAGAATTVFFYYSGHAKASALNLADEELELDVLRERLLAIPSTLTVVVLDACQSGAFSRVKGAEPAADFSFNSKSRLDATGVAVLASSTGSELSQESDLLQSSYFTHHLLVGLRGAADQSDDGRVTIDEAYRYAYHQTLLATSATAVGSQHVSLEVDLKGHGEVALSYPEKATALIELPADLAGEILVEKTKAKAVLAELHKAAGAAVRVAVAPGEYRVLIRRDEKLERCPIVVKSGTAVLDLDGCDPIPQVDTATKGWASETDGWPGVLSDGRRLAIDFTVGLGKEMRDAYTDRLADFGYDGDQGAARLTLGGRYRTTPHIQLGGAVGMTTSARWSRGTGTDSDPLRFSWRTYSILATARLDHTPFDGRLRVFVQAGGGLGIGRTELRDESDREFAESSTGIVLNGSAGFEWTLPWWRGVGFGMAYTFQFAPVITNLTGDRHLGVGNFLDVTWQYRF